jgi:hypothetical protein
MPTAIYDCSLITSRERVKVTTNSFINRIQNQSNPTTSYGPMLGIYDSSIINSINNGQMKYFRRNQGCNTVDNGCPCAPINNNNNNTIAPPGEIPYINIRYSSIIVEWGEPLTGTKPFTYTVYAISDTSTVISPPTYNTMYVFETGTLASGIDYIFKVIASNGAGETVRDYNIPTPAPYGPPDIITILNESQPGSIKLYINSSPFNPLSEGAEYKLSTYINDVEVNITDFLPFPGSMIYPIEIPIDNLLSSYLYSFRVQIKDSVSELSSFSNKPINIQPLPGAPQNVTWTALSTTSIRVSYNNFSQEAGGFSLIGASCIITNGYSLYLNTTNLTNTSVDIINLSPHTTYYDFTIQFVLENVSSLTSDIEPFTTL